MALDEVMRPAEGPQALQWTPVVVGALCAAAFSFILIAFAVAVGLGVSSSAPTWRDASAALALLSGIYLILQAIVSFGIGGYVAGRMRLRAAAGAPEQVEGRDGMHGLACWALAILIGATLAAVIGASGLPRQSTSARPTGSAAEPLLSYELDRLFRTTRRPANLNLAEERAEAGRILLTSSSHSGVSADDRTFLVQQVAAATGLAAGEAERRVDSTIADSKAAIARSRRSAIIIAFSVAAAALLGAIAARAAATVGGRHRDGAPLPEWMQHADRFERRSVVMPGRR